VVTGPRGVQIGATTLAPLAESKSGRWQCQSKWNKDPRLSGSVTNNCCQQRFDFAQLDAGELTIPQAN